MRQLLEEMLRIHEAGENQVLVTVIAESGSTPRGAGARMIVRQDKSTLGTVGGGAIEYQSGKLAGTVMENKSSLKKSFQLSKNELADLGMICGGNVTVYFQYIGKDRQDFPGICKEALVALEKEEDSWIVTSVADGEKWSMAVCYSESEMKRLAGADAGCLIAPGPVLTETDQGEFYCEPLVKSEKVYVFGGGHVAQELVPMLAHLGFRCVVFDDREEFANRQVFPQAYETVIGDFRRITDFISIREQDYLCIMTRGHQFDYLVQQQSLKTPARYIGVMGSRNKLKLLNDRLLEEGFTVSDISRFHGPIGTPILAETPAEIAVSVAGELIQVRALAGGKKVGKNSGKKM